MEPDDLEQDQQQDQTEGAIPAPPISTDNSAPNSQPGPQPTQSAIPDGGPEKLGGDRPFYEQDNGMLPINAAREGAKDLIGYIMGKGAAPQQQADAAAQAVDPEGKMTPEDRNLLAVHQAAEMGGPGAAWAMVQANRQAYNGKQAFARAALNGIDGKAGDLAAAADAATKASSHVLDGSVATFHPDQDGVMADVTLPGQKHSMRIKLTPEQLNQYLDVGKDGQYDKLLQAGGVPQVLQQIAKGPGVPLTGPGPQQRVRSQESIDAERQQPGNKTGHLLPKNLYERADDGEDGLPPEPEKLETDPQRIRDNEEYDAIAERAKRIFPRDSQSPQREQWRQTKEAEYKDRQNKVDTAAAGFKSKEAIANTNVKGKEGAATIYTGGKVRAAEIKAEADKAKVLQNAQHQADVLAQNAKTADERNRVRMAIAEATNPNRVLMTDAETAAIWKKHGLNVGGPGVAPPTGEAAPPPTGQAAPAPTGQSSVPPVAQRQTGQVYTTPKGQFKWMGNGWQRVE